MKLLQKIFLLSFGLFLTGCEDVITVDLDTAPPRLVIDACIDWVKNTTGNEQKIKLSTTTGYYSPNFPTVSGATISVSNSANTVFAFYGSDGVVVDPEDYDFFVDNFVIEHSATLATNDNLKKNTNVVVYPNPFVDFLNVKNSDLVKSASITDFNGRVVKRFEDINI